MDRTWALQASRRNLHPISNSDGATGDPPAVSTKFLVRAINQLDRHAEVRPC